MAVLIIKGITPLASSNTWQIRYLNKSSLIRLANYFPKQGAHKKKLQNVSKNEKKR